jgi:hypothetical protein
LLHDFLISRQLIKNSRIFEIFETACWEIPYGCFKLIHSFSPKPFGCITYLVAKEVLHNTHTSSEACSKNQKSLSLH